MNNFIKLTKCTGKSIIIRTNDILQVTDGEVNNDVRIIRYMLNDHMNVEHVIEPIDEIYAMLLLGNEELPGMKKKHLNS